MLRCRTMLALGRFADASADAEAATDMSDEIGEGGRGYINHVASHVLSCVACTPGTPLTGLSEARRAAIQMQQIVDGCARPLAAWMTVRLDAVQGNSISLACTSTLPWPEPTLDQGHATRHSPRRLRLRPARAGAGLARRSAARTRLLWQVVWHRSRRRPGFPLAACRFQSRQRPGGGRLRSRGPGAGDVRGLPRAALDRRCTRRRGHPAARDVAGRGGRSARGGPRHLHGSRSPPRRGASARPATQTRHTTHARAFHRLFKVAGTQ